MHLLSAVVGATIVEDITDGDDSVDDGFTIEELASFCDVDANIVEISQETVVEDTKTKVMSTLSVH